MGVFIAKIVSNNKDNITNSGIFGVERRGEMLLYTKRPTVLHVYLLPETPKTKMDLGKSGLKNKKRNRLYNFK